MKVVSSSASPGMFLVLIFTRGWVDPRAMVRSEGNMSLKNPVTPPGIDPGTVRLVAQRLNHYATPGPSVSSTCNNCHQEKGSILRCFSLRCDWEEGNPSFRRGLSAWGRCQDNHSMKRRISITINLVTRASCLWSNRVRMNQVRKIV